MISDEIKELNHYLRLSSYRDGDYLLEEEYQELEDILKRNPDARFLEDVRYEYLTCRISREEYDQICDDRVSKLSLRQGKHRCDE